MKSYVFIVLAVLQSLGCSGLPLINSELQSAAERGLQAALAKVNSVYAVGHLYRVTHGSLTRVVPAGLSSVDMLIKFGIKQTECAKGSGEDPQRCSFKPGFFVPSFPCVSHVRLSATSTQVVSLRCGRDSSSSSESSEEVFARGTPQFNIPFGNRADPAPTAPPPATQPDGHNQIVEVRPRGDTFNNYVVRMSSWS